ncbi:hypothetical protein M1145_00870 [Patescibacteria group bacterium]|nr:hypothetical protein [Patescibacteria group bacterium]
MPKKDIKIALIPLEYYEGVPRSLSNGGFFTVKDIQYPIIVRVSMNLTNIDISHIKNPNIGDEVIVFPNNVAKTINDIPYTVPTHINSSIKREII